MKSRILFCSIGFLGLASFSSTWIQAQEAAEAVVLDTGFIQKSQSTLDRRMDRVLEDIKVRYSFAGEAQESDADAKPVWTARHNEVLKSIYQNCGPSGNGQTVMDCEGIGFGVDLVKDKLEQENLPGFKSNSEIKYKDPEHERMHMDLVVSGVGTSRALGELIEYNLLILDEEPEKAAQIFLQDPALRLHVEDAKQQPDRYMGVIGRVASADQIMSSPYNGNLEGFLDDQYFMGDSEQKALVIGMNYIQALTADASTKEGSSVYANRLLGSDGRIMDSEIEEALRKGGEIYILADATIEAIADQLEAFPDGLIDLESEDPFKGLREYVEAKKLQAGKPAVRGLIQEETWRQLLELKTKDQWGYDKYGARLINENGIRSICRESGVRGFRPPRGSEACQKAYFEGYREFEPGFRDNPQYADESTGKFSEKLLLAGVKQRRESLIEETSKEDGEVTELIQVLAGDSAIREYVRMDIRNNPEQFAKSELLLGSQGATPVDQEKLKNLISKAESDLGPGTSSSDLPFSLFSDCGDGFGLNAASEIRSDTAPTSQPSKSQAESPREKKLVALLGNSNQKPRVEDEGSSAFNSFGGPGFSGLNPWGQAKDNPGGYRQQSPTDRGNLLKFPEALQELLPVDGDGNPFMKQAVGIFCRPENYVLKDDPYCTCLHGPRIRIFYDETELEDCREN